MVLKSAMRHPVQPPATISPAPASPSSDKENAVQEAVFGTKSHQSPTLASVSAEQRVRNIVDEFNKITDECMVMAAQCEKQKAAEEPLNRNFVRAGFTNASLRSSNPPAQAYASFNAHARRQPLTASASNLLDGPRVTGRLDRITTLENDLKIADGELQRALDVTDSIAIQCQENRLRDRYMDLRSNQMEVQGLTGGRQTAIIDKRARTYLQDVERKLNALQQRRAELSRLLPLAKQWEASCGPLARFVVAARDQLQRIRRAASVSATAVDHLLDEMEAQRGELLRCGDLCDRLGAEFPSDEQTKLRERFDEIHSVWTNVEGELLTLRNSLEVQTDRDDLSAALNEATQWLEQHLRRMRSPTGSPTELPIGASPFSRVHQLLSNRSTQHLSASLKAQLDHLSQLDNEFRERSQKLREQTVIQTDAKTGKVSPAVSADSGANSLMSSDSPSDGSLPTSSSISTHANVQFDPTEIAEILQGLHSYDRIRFAAYRTGMKLFALQKRLCFDLIDLCDLDKEFRLLPAGSPHLPMESLFTLIRPLFENAHIRFPKSLPRVRTAIQLCIDFLKELSVTAETRLIMTALILLCSAKVEDKHRYLFLMYATDGEKLSADELKALFVDLAKFPHLIGESSAFGGFNVDSSVRACLHFTAGPQRNTTAIEFADFLRWIQSNPQTLVWIRCFHRLAASEFAKHQVRCAHCKMFPVVGMRFRCLHCFGVDLCQNCFLTQRQVRGHKYTHEIHEYYAPTSTIDNLRDFSQIVHNKVRRSKSSAKIGYTPVDILPPAAVSTLIHPPNRTFSANEQMLMSAQTPTSGMSRVDVDAIIEQARRDGRLPSQSSSVFSTPLQPLGRPVRTPLSFTNSGDYAAIEGKMTPMARDRENATPVSALNSSVPAVATPDEMSLLIQELRRENLRLKCAYEKARLNGRSGMLTSPGNLPPALRLDEPTARFDEALNCLLTLTDAPTMNC